MKKSIFFYTIIVFLFGVTVLNACKKNVTPFDGLDATKPILTLIGLPNCDIILNSANYLDPGCTAMDDRDGDVTQSINITGTVNTNLAGTYTLTYTAHDYSGNINSIHRNVRVYNQAEILQGYYSVYDSTLANPNYFYSDVITPSVTINNRVLISKFAAYNPCVVYGNKIGLTIDIPTQTIFNVGNPPIDRTFSSLSSSIVIGLNTMLTIYYSETTNGNTIYGKGTYTKQ